MASQTRDYYLFVIMGALGDLSRRKLLPAIYHLAADRELGGKYVILGADLNGEFDDAKYRSWARRILNEAGFPVDQDASRWCDQCLRYQPVGKDDYGALVGRIRAIEQEAGLPGNRIFYLAIPSQAVPHAIGKLGEIGLNHGPGWARVVMEKPFGHDLASAQRLNEITHRYFEESQVYRLDHYLGKDTVQNLLALRFANPVFEQLWNRENIQSVEITAAEDLGLEGRANYYDGMGAFRDMMQNHLTQLLTLVAMEVPSAFEADAIRYEKQKVLREVAPLSARNVVFGRYARGKVGGREVPGYLEESGVSPESKTETFVAMKLEVASWRWKGVNFYLRTGKRLVRQRTQIVVTYRTAPVSIFHPFQESCELNPNRLVIRVQPEEGFDLLFQVKALGEPFRLSTQELRFRYKDAFGPVRAGYETLLLEVIKGNLSLFVCADEIEYAWRLYDHLLHEQIPVHEYAAGTWGPPEISRLYQDWSSQQT